jgi:hypothetical protein
VLLFLYFISYGIIPSKPACRQAGLEGRRARLDSLGEAGELEKGKMGKF